MAPNNMELGTYVPLDHTAPDVTFPLLSLPDIALARVSQYSITQREVWPGPHSSHPLLSASREFRDMALRSIHSITLDASRSDSESELLSVLDELPEACDPAPWARLLHRACCQAAPGLTVKLHLARIHDRLRPLLQPGIDCGGWSKVHSLEVRAIHVETSESLSCVC
jgi:hypothetical protein